MSEVGDRKMEIVSLKVALLLAAGWGLGELTYVHLVNPTLRTMKLTIA